MHTLYLDLLALFFLVMANAGQEGKTSDFREKKREREILVVLDGVL